MPTVFLLSPARCSGRRADMLATSSRSALGEQLRGRGAPVGDVFAWLSALYFRGKLAYGTAFGRALVMAPGAGLLAPETLITAAELRAMGEVDVESDAFVRPLRRHAKRLPARDPIVLLGSIATGKYTTALLDVLGKRLAFPAAFVGRGDMSRGGLMLRAAKTGIELEYTA
ncbi:MAG: hypothetical protein ACM31C_10110, partial [Acidobacteriota bacterium]